MTRATYLAWCKVQAIEALRRGTIHAAYEKFVNLLDQHEETRGSKLIQEGKILLYGGGLATAVQMEKFINDFV